MTVIKYGLSFALSFTIVHFIHTGTLTSSVYSLVLIVVGYSACLHTVFSYNSYSKHNGMNAILAIDDAKMTDQERYLERLSRDARERDSKLNQEGKIKQQIRGIEDQAQDRIKMQGHDMIKLTEENYDLVMKLKEFWFEPKNMRQNLTRSIYLLIEQHLVSTRMLHI